MIVGQYGSAGDEIQWERDRNIKQHSGISFANKKKMCRKCKLPKEAKGGTNKNFIFICKDCK